MKSTWILLTTTLFLGFLPLPAAGAGSEVIVVYNSRVPESKELAEYYARKRNVPAGQVFGFELSTGQEMTRTEFRESLQKPLAKKLDAEKLWRMGTDIIRSTNDKPQRVVWKVKQSAIRYAVLCYGVPVSIAKEPNHKGNGDEKTPPELRRDEAAVDSELALLPMIEENLPVAGPLSNPFFRATNAFSIGPTNGVLMVTRLDGPTAAIARGLVDKALEAETNGLWGRAYFDLRNISDPGYKLGDDWIRASATLCEKLGFEVEVDDRPETFPAEFPMSQIAIYCGWYNENVSGPFTRRHVEFMPGAFAYHLHSFSAAHLRSSTENWVGPLLAKGATISMGCVYEPYLVGTPEVAVFLARFIYDRMSFGEAAYAAQPLLSWQTTIVGDPLYCPFRTPPEQLHQQLLSSHNKLVEWSFLRLIDSNLANGRPASRMSAFLENVTVRKESAVLTEKLADLYVSLGKPASAIETYEQALEVDTSPLQRVRLRLKLGDTLAESKLDQKAFENYASLLREDPDYPKKVNIYRKLSTFARKLGKNSEAATYDDLIKALTPPPPPLATPK